MCPKDTIVFNKRILPFDNLNRSRRLIVLMCRECLWHLCWNDRTTIGYFHRLTSNRINYLNCRCVSQQYNFTYCITSFIVKNTSLNSDTVGNNFIWTITLWYFLSTKVTIIDFWTFGILENTYKCKLLSLRLLAVVIST